MDPAVRQNLRRMTTNMQEFITLESMGGNASTYRGKPCVAVNFTYNNLNGDILEFTNHAQRKPGRRDGLFRLQISISETTRKYPRIINFRFAPDTTEKARLNLELSVKVYNQL